MDIKMATIVKTYSLANITPEKVTSILDDVEKVMFNMQESAQLRNRVYSVLVELLQNMYLHKDDALNEGEDRTGLAIDKEAGYYRIITSNYIANNKIPALRTRMDKINSLKPEEINKEYLKILNSSQLSEKGGAGLGMLAIVRKSGNPLSYDFTPVDNHFSFFTLRVTIE
jgi:hypothetical protein